MSAQMPFVKWPSELPPPIFPEETLIRQRAQSALTGSLIEGVCPPLSIDQARDVLAWYEPKH